MTKVMKTMDGNTAAADASMHTPEVAAIYPITPSTPMAETVDEWACPWKEKYIWSDCEGCGNAVRSRCCRLYAWP